MSLVRLAARVGCLVALLVAGFAGAALPAWAQQEGLLQLDDPIHRFLTRQQVHGRLPDAFLTHRPLSAYQAQQYLDTLAVQPGVLSPVDRRLLARYRGAAPGPGVQTAQRLLPFAYPDGTSFLGVQHEDYGFEVEPLAYLAYGQARRTAREDADPTVPVWQNTRGIRAAGHIGRYAFFEARVTENQERVAWPVFRRDLQSVPRLGFAKFNGENQSYDYFQATGVVGFRSQYFEARLGRDRNQWGYGRSGLTLSNYAPVYDQLQLRTTVWRFQYTNLFVARSEPNEVAGFVPRRYGAFHRLEVDMPARLRLSFFEAVMFAEGDSLGLRDAAFDFTYLNPVIFLRSAEHDRGSPDNALLGGGLSWIPVPRARLYGELLLDELDFAQIGEQWWANKWGWLVGVEVADLPLPTLFVQLEYARLRPYFYAHDTPSSAFLHYADGLGHPAGPNAIDVAARVAYQPTTRIGLTVDAAHTRRGRNTATENFGADPGLSTDSRVANFGIEQLQGVRQTHWLVEARADYELLPSLFASLALRAESIDDAETGRDRYVAPFVLLRWGLPFGSVRY